MKPIILIVGNCQASFVANFLKSLPEIGQQYEIRRFRNYNYGLDMESDAVGEPQGDASRYIRNHKQRIAAFLRQATHNWIGDPITAQDFAPHTVLVEFPFAQQGYLWPRVCIDERFSSMPGAVRRHYPYTLHDSLLRKLALEGVPENEIVDAYMADDVTAAFPLDRLKALNDAKARQIDAKSSFPMGDFIAANWTQAQLFRTLNHPSGLFMAEMMRRILAQLPFATDHEVAAYRIAIAAEGPGIQDFDAPVDPRIVRHFGLTWAAADRFNAWEEGSFSFAEHLLRLYRMQWSGKAEEALRLHRLGDIPAALSMMEEALAEAPRSIRYRLRISDLYDLRKQYDMALAVVVDAWAIEPSLEVGVKLVQAQLNARKMHDAELMAAEVEARFGRDRAEVVLMRAKFMQSTKDRRGAIERLRVAAASPARSDYRIWLLLGSLLVRDGDPNSAHDAWARAHILSGMAPSIARKLDALRAAHVDVRTREV